MSACKLLEASTPGLQNWHELMPPNLLLSSADGLWTVRTPFPGSGFHPGTRHLPDSELSLTWLWPCQRRCFPQCGIVLGRSLLAKNPSCSPKPGLAQLEVARCDRQRTCLDDGGCKVPFTVFLLTLPHRGRHAMIKEHVAGAGLPHPSLRIFCMFFELFLSFLPSCLSSFLFILLRLLCFFYYCFLLFFFVLFFRDAGTLRRGPRSHTGSETSSVQKRCTLLEKP